MFKFSGILKKYTKASNFEKISEVIFQRKLGSGIEHSLIDEKIEQIQYEFVETYWKKKYGWKQLTGDTSKVFELAADARD